MPYDLLGEEKKLLEFACSCRYVYIYGAGNFGRGYLDILQRYGYSVDGFIVTEKRGSTYLNKPIYSIDEALEMMSEKDGVIPAFTNSNVRELEERFEKKNPKILDFDHEIMLCMEDRLHFYPILDKLDQKFSRLEKQIDTSRWDNILIVRLDAIGDMVFTTPFIRELRKNFPKSHIAVALRKQNQKILEHCPYIDELFLYESALRDGELSQQCQNYPELSVKIQEFAEQNFKNKKFDVVFFPRELLCGRNVIDELLIAYYSGARYRIGRILPGALHKQYLCKKLRDSFTMISAMKEPMHEAAYALDMLKQCGCVVDDERMELWTDSRGEQRAVELFEEKQIQERDILIALGIVASVDTRTWKIENYNQVIRYYGEQFGTRIRFAIMGGDDAREAAGQIDDAYGNVIDLAGKTDLNETAACMERCSLYVGSNTGLLHFASAFAVPSVTIYSELSDGLPTDGDSPFRMGAWKVPHIDLVPPAGLDGCHGVCRMRFSHCINQILPEQVTDSINKLLKLEPVDP